MQYVNLFFRYLIILFIITAPSSCTAAEMEEELIQDNNQKNIIYDYNNNDDNIFLLFDVDPEMEDYLEETTNVHKNNNNDPLVILGILDFLEIINILKIPFFRQTDSLFQRSILDLPMVDTSPLIQRRETLMYLPSLFLEKTKTDDEFFEKYLALRNPALIEAIETTFERAKELLGDTSVTDFNIDKILELISHSYVEQRIGAIPLFVSRAFKKWCFRFATSLQYDERNFFLTDENKELLIEELDLSQSSDDSFTRQHLVSDLVGIGDIRLEGEKIVQKGLYHSTHLGFYTVLPTAFPLKKGIFGTSFRKPSTFPAFDFNLIFDLLEKHDVQGAIDFFSRFFLDASDRLAADLLTPQLGIFPHVALGLYIRMKSRLSSFVKFQYADRLIFKNHIEFEYLTPGSQDVFYVTKTNPEEFDELDIEEILIERDPVRAAAAVNFIERKIVEDFFLRAFKTRVQPGPHFRWSSAWIFLLTERSKIMVGSDYFYKAKDHILDIHVPYDIRKTLDARKAAQKSLSITTIFLKYLYNYSTESSKNQFTIGIHASDSSHNNAFRGWGLTLEWKVEF